MKASIDGQIRLIPETRLDEQTIQSLVGDYTFEGVEDSLDAWDCDISKNEWSFPWQAKARSGVEVILDNRAQGRKLSLGKSLFNPRVGQKDTVAEAVSRLKLHNTAMLIAGCGTGKTVMGAEIALRLGLSTCVLVHKEFLADQWEEAFEMVCPGIRIGRLQRDQCDTGHDYDVVLAVTQSVTNSRREYPIEFYRSFGLVIGDEVHRYAAGVWQKAITSFPAAYRLGLTATPYRGDRMWPVLEAHFGGQQVKLQGESLVPLIYPIRTTAIPLLNVDQQPWLSDMQKRAKLLSELAGNESRNEVVVRNIKKAVAAGRKTMVISERRSQLEWFGERLEAYGITDVGYYVGGKKMAALDVAATKKIVFTTYQMAKEGLNIPDLDVLVMASPQAHIEQTVGRILRLCEGKGRPTVLDFVDEEIDLMHGLWFSRLKEYKRLQYEVNG